jgi:hypothetical protein
MGNRRHDSPDRVKGVRLLQGQLHRGSPGAGLVDRRDKLDGVAPVPAAYGGAAPLFQGPQELLDFPVCTV